MKKVLKQFLLSIITVGLSVVIGIVCLVLVYMIPMQNIHRHVKESSAIFEREGESPKIWYFYATVLDNYTDAIMILEADNSNGEALTESALINYWNRTITDGKLDNPGPSLVNMSNFPDEYSITNGNVSISEYSRYWHGYLVILKLLLYAFNYGTIRIINLVIQLLIEVYIVWKFVKNRYKYTALGYALSMLLLCPLTCGFSLQYSSCLYILNIGILLIIKKYERNKESFSCTECTLIFTILGILTSYFDFLTYPITTLCIPLTTAIIFSMDEGPFKSQFATFVKMGVFWVIGYLGMWTGKWCAASMLTDRNVLAEAINSVLYRTAGGEGTAIMAIVRNVGVFLINPVSLFTILIWCLFYYKLVFSHGFKIMAPAKCKILLIIALMPLAWYIVATNHSYVHFWFTFRNMIICVIAGFAAYDGLILQEKGHGK